MVYKMSIVSLTTLRQSYVGRHVLEFRLTFNPDITKGLIEDKSNTDSHHGLAPSFNSLRPSDAYMRR